MNELLKEDENHDAYMGIDNASSGLISTKTRQVRYREWIKENLFAAETNKKLQSKCKSKQERIRGTIKDEIDILGKLNDPAQI